MAVQPRRNADVMPLPAWLGQYAGTPWRHPFRSYITGGGAPQCGGCFGWTDDPRHWTGVRPAVTASDDHEKQEGSTV